MTNASLELMITIGLPVPSTDQCGSVSMTRYINRWLHRLLANHTKVTSED